MTTEALSHADMTETELEEFSTEFIELSVLTELESRASELIISAILELRALEDIATLAELASGTALDGIVLLPVTSLPPLQPTIDVITKPSSGKNRFINDALLK